jgi:hypothetical protein
MVQRISPIYAAEAPFVDFAAAIKQSVPAPVIASDTIHDPALAEGIVRRGLADLVSMARPNFADPDVAGKVQVMPCIRCNACVGQRARKQASLLRGQSYHRSRGRTGDTGPAPAARPRGWGTADTSSHRLHGRFACARLSQPCLLGSSPNVSATFTTIAFDDSSLQWLEINT